IMGPYQGTRCFTHPLHIERPVVPGDFFSHMRRPNLIVVDHITVTPSARLEARMEMCRHDFGPGNADIAWQIGIGAHYPGDQGPLHWRIEMHDLPAGMHTGIGTPCAHQVYWLGRHT